MYCECDIPWSVFTVNQALHFMNTCYKRFCYRLLHLSLFSFANWKMAETDEFNVEDQLNYEAETGEGGEGEVFKLLTMLSCSSLIRLHLIHDIRVNLWLFKGEDESADIGDDPELEAIKVFPMQLKHNPNILKSLPCQHAWVWTPSHIIINRNSKHGTHKLCLKMLKTLSQFRQGWGPWRKKARS